MLAEHPELQMILGPQTQLVCQFVKISNTDSNTKTSTQKQFRALRTFLLHHAYMPLGSLYLIAEPYGSLEAHLAFVKLFLQIADRRLQVRLHPLFDGDLTANAFGLLKDYLIFFCARKQTKTC